MNIIRIYGNIRGEHQNDDAFLFNRFKRFLPILTDLGHKHFKNIILNSAHCTLNVGHQSYLSRKGRLALRRKLWTGQIQKR